ncbi:MAG: radical SAM protein [bacterium]
MFSHNIDRRFVSWNTEPAVFAILKSLTPQDIETDFIDERYEEVRYSPDYDLVVFSVKTYNARNSYNISSQFRKLGVRTIAGGCHTMLNPEETGRHFDSIVLGDAESTWHSVMNDLRNSTVKSLYRSDPDNRHFAMPDRSIYDKYRYLPMHLVESSRGCPYKCRFCSTASVSGGLIKYRDPGQIDSELKQLRNSIVLFTDENIAADRKHLMTIARYAGSHNVRWIAQADISIADDNTLRYIARNGCRGLLIGFESMSDKMLKSYNKQTNIHKDYAEVIDKLHHYGIMVYASFIFDSDEFDALNSTSDFILNNNPDLCGLSPLTPFPGTPLYEEKLKLNPSVKNWWLRETYPYFRFVFNDRHSGQMESNINNARRSIYSLRGIIKRMNLSNIISHPTMALFSALFNLMGMAEVRSKSNITKSS